MGRIFDERHRFDLWLEIELAVAEGWSKLGRIPAADYKKMSAKAKFDMAHMRAHEKKVEHEVVAFVTTVGESLGDLSRYLHLGLTSSDVMDTAQSMQMQEAWAALLPSVTELLDMLSALAVKHKRTVMIGRTHGIHAEPITFGLKVLVWQQELGRDLERLERAQDETAVGKLSGSVGNYAHIPPSLEDMALEKLGLRPDPVSNQIVQRDRHAAALTSLALLGGTIERIATEIRSLQRTEIGELAEPFAAGQKGSSSMPHKRNPILCERMSGMARMLRGYAHAAMENMQLWNERDISHSSAERVIIADAFTIADYMVEKMQFIIGGLAVNAKRMEDNIGMTRGLIFSQRLLIALTDKGVARDDAYRMVQEPAMKSFEEGKHFYNLVKESREIRKHLSLIELSDVFSVEPYLAHVDEIFHRVDLGEAPRAMRGLAKATPARGGRPARPVRPARPARVVQLKPLPVEAPPAPEPAPVETPAEKPARGRRGGRGRKPAKADTTPKEEAPLQSLKAPKPETAESPYSALKGWRGRPAAPKPAPAPEPAPDDRKKALPEQTIDDDPPPRKPRGRRGGRGRGGVARRSTTPKTEK